MKTSIKTVLATILAMLLFLLGAACPAIAAPKQATIDVLVVFDKTAIEALKKKDPYKDGLNLAVLGPEPIARMAMAELNNVLTTSHIGKQMKFNCCGIFYADYRTQAKLGGIGIGRDVDALWDGKGPTGVIRGKLADGRRMTLNEAKDATKADLYVMFVSYPLINGEGGTLGVASTGAYSNILGNRYIGISTSCAFNVCTIRKGDPTFSHEVCHLLGGGHSDFQLSQTGPQAEGDAAGWLSEDQKFSTLMTYEANLDIRTNFASKDNKGVKRTIYIAEPLKVLSNPHPHKIRKTGQTVKVGDLEHHNNAAVILRHASPVSIYRISGNEQIINDDFDQALPIPPLESFAKKKGRKLKSIALREIMGPETPAGKKLAQKIFEYWVNMGFAPQTVNEDPDFFISSYLGIQADKIDQICAELINNSQLDQVHISRELRFEDEANTYVSSVIGTTTVATAEAGEPKLEGGQGRTVWYAVTPPVAGDMEVTIRKAASEGNNTYALGVFTGNRVNSLSAVEHTSVSDANNDYYIERIKVNVDKGQKLYIAVDSKRADVIDNFNLTIILHKGTYNGAPAPAPAPEPTPAPAPGGASQISEWRTADYALLATSLLALLVSMGTIIALVSKQEKEQPDIGGLPPIAPPQGIAVPPGSNQQMEVHAETPRHASPSIPDMKICLRGVLSNGSPAEYTISLREVAQHHNFYIGRDPSCHLCIPDETISHSHAVLKLRPDGKALALLLGDNGSSNGTRIGDVRLNKKGECVKVHNRTRVSFGKSEFVITLSK